MAYQKNLIFFSFHLLLLCCFLCSFVTCKRIRTDGAEQSPTGQAINTAEGLCKLYTRRILADFKDGEKLDKYFETYKVSNGDQTKVIDLINKMIIKYSSTGKLSDCKNFQTDLPKFPPSFTNFLAEPLLNYKEDVNELPKFLPDNIVAAAIALRNKRKKPVFGKVIDTPRGNTNKTSPEPSPAKVAKKNADVGDAIMTDEGVCKLYIRRTLSEINDKQKVKQYIKKSNMSTKAEEDTMEAIAAILKEFGGEGVNKMPQCLKFMKELTAFPKEFLNFLAEPLKNSKLVPSELPDGVKEALANLKKK